MEFPMKAIGESIFRTFNLKGRIFRTHTPDESNVAKHGFIIDRKIRFVKIYLGYFKNSIIFLFFYLKNGCF